MQLSNDILLCLNDFKRKYKPNCNLHDICGIFGYDLIKIEDENLLGICDGWTNQIGLSEHSSDLEEIETLSHELGHAIQFKCEIFEKRTWVLSEELKIEWQSDLIGKEIFKIIYPTIKIPSNFFQSYKTEKQILFLKEYYSGWIEDDLNLTKKIYY